MGIKLLSTLIGSENTAVASCYLSTTEGMSASGLTHIYVPINTTTDACGLHVGTAVHGLFMGGATATGFVPRIKGQAYDSTDQGIKIIGSTSGDTGSGGAVWIDASNAAGGALANRGIVDFSNNNILKACIDKDGHMHSACFCGGLAGSSTSANNATCLGGVASTSYLRSDVADIKTSGNLTFNDGIQAVFGTDNDFGIAHDGSNAFIVNGSGETRMRINISEDGIIIRPNSCVSLYYDNAEKLKTISAGACTVGTHYATTFNGNATSATNADTVDSLHATSFVRKDVANQSSSFPTNCLIFSYTDAANVDHIWYEDTNNSFNFTADAALGGTANASINAGILCGNTCVRGATVCGSTNVNAGSSLCVNGILLENATDRGGLLEINRQGTTSYTGTQIKHATALWSVMGSETLFGMYDDTNSKWIMCYAENGAVGMNHNGSQRLVTSSAGATTAGVHTATRFTSSQATGTAPFTVASTTTVTNLSADYLDGISSGSFLRSDAADIQTSGGLRFNDNIVASFGSSNDLRIFHDGIHSYMCQCGTGNLYIRNPKDTCGYIYLQVGALNETALLAIDNSCVALYYNGAQKFKTVSLGTCTVGNHYGTTSCFTQHRSSCLCATSCLDVAAGFTGVRTKLCISCACAVDWIATSDCRKKKCIEPYAECGIDKINHLAPVRYNWCHDDTADIGFIAQDVIDVEPDLVIGNDKDGWGLKYDKISAMTVKAIQELSCEVKELKAEIEILKNK